MKYIIVGLHSSGKQSIIDFLTDHNISCGKLFSNLDKNALTQQESDNIYNIKNYETYDMSEICSIFENNAYIFIKDMDLLEPIPFSFTAFKVMEGLSKYEFETHDVFMLSPDQLLSISPNSIKEPVCFIWVDNNKANRKNRHRSENRNYNFNEREAIERKDINSFVKSMYGFNKSHVLYFNNEEPERVATIIYSLIKYPDLINIYSKTFI